MSLSSTNANTYRVGDFVYFDDSTATDAPWQIRKIDELLKSDKGVEARCVVYMRRRDIPQHLLKIADQAKRRFDNYYEVDKKKPEGFTTKGFIVANGSTESGDVKDEEMEVDGDDEPPKIDAEEAAPAAVNQGRTSSSDSAKENVTENKDSSKEAAEQEAIKLIDWGDGGLPLGVDNLAPEQRLRLRQHEIFMTRQSEILPASLIRGKCRVVLLGDCEDAEIYLPHEDTFFHSLVYDPTAQTLLADKGAIRVGEKYQAEVDAWMEPAELEKKEREERLARKIRREEEEEAAAAAAASEELEKDEKEKEDIENGNEEKEDVKPKIEAAEPKKSDENEDIATRDIPIWDPNHGLLDKDIDQYLIIARSVGLFARAIDCASAPKLPTLQLAAAFASRDITVLHAHGILHQASYDVGQAVKFLVPVASREAYPCQIDEAIGVQTKTLGGPILCRDQLEEWSTPEMNLFEDALDKVGKDFSEIRADYLPWKSVRDIVEYYYLMKASNRYSDRKKNKSGSGGSEDTKLTQVYIPTFNKSIPATIGAYNTSQNLVRSEVGCENCGTMDAINWYQWGGVEKKVLCSGCWVKWKKFAGLNEKHELERFDKTRPPVLDQQTPTASGSTSNGNDRPPVLQVQQRNPATPNNSGANQTRGAQPLTPNQQSISKQNLIMVAKEALRRGQISQEQYNQLSRNFPHIAVAEAAAAAAAMAQQAQVQQQQTAQTPAVATVQKKKATPATKPPIVFYTTICRRAVRRLLPKTAFNLRKLSRKPFSTIDYEAILKSVIVMDKATLLRSAQIAAGDKIGSIVEADFHKGITHLQHVLSQATTGKRSASNTTHSGEPTAKMAKQIPTFISSPTLVTPPSLEDVGNCLLAVNQAMKCGQSYVHLSQPPPCELFRAPLPPPSVQPQNQTQNQIPIKTNAEKIRELWKTPTDSRWFVVNDEICKYRAGPKLKIKRRKLISRSQARTIARHPTRIHAFLQPLWPIIHPYFLIPINASFTASSSSPTFSENDSSHHPH
uniref:Uncharacterized protein n=1 Tax=Caenorhabditis japonica TaxID=281687 RepID=A0A8R1DQR5_CAEJA